MFSTGNADGAEKKNAFQGETDFTGWERAVEWELEKCKKTRRGERLAPRALVLIRVFCQNT